MSPTRYVMLGDSITRFWSLHDEAIFKVNGIANEGISGQVSREIVARFACCIEKYRPALVMLLAGTNDIAGNDGEVSNDEILANLEGVMSAGRGFGVTVVACSIPPATSFYWSPVADALGRIQALNAGIRRLAEGHDLPFADYHAAMVGRDGGFREGLSDDGIHPNANGYSLMRPVALTAMARIEAARA